MESSNLHGQNVHKSVVRGDQQAFVHMREYGGRENPPTEFPVC